MRLLTLYKVYTHIYVFTYIYLPILFKTHLKANKENKSYTYDGLSCSSISFNSTNKVVKTCDFWSQPTKPYRPHQFLLQLTLPVVNYHHCEHVLDF